MKFYRKLKNIRKNQSGAVAVEFALVSLIFFTLTLGSFDIMSMMQANSVLQWAVTTEARNVMVAPLTTTSGAQTAAQSIASNAGYTMTFTAATAACGTSTGQCMTITGTYTYKFFLISFGKISVVLTKTALANIS
jgi:Flp pilus assembly protein TadG